MTTPRVLAALAALSLAAAPSTANGAALPFTLDPSDNFGTSLAALGDWDGDGIPDVDPVLDGGRRRPRGVQRQQRAGLPRRRLTS